MPDHGSAGGSSAADGSGRETQPAASSAAPDASETLGTQNGSREGRQGVGLGTVWLAGAAVVTALSGLAIATLLTRHLGREGYGEVTAMVAWASAIATLSDGGLTVVLTREAAQRPDERAGLFRGGTRRRALFAALGLTVGVLVPWIAGEAEPSVLAVAAMCLAFQFDLFLELALVMLRVQARFRGAALWRAGRRLSLVVLIAVGVILGIDSSNSALVFLLSAVPITLMANLSVARHNHCGSSSRLPLPKGDSILLWISGVAYWIYFQADQIMLGVLHSKSELAVYAPAVAIASGILLLLRAVSDTMLPMLFEQMNTGGRGSEGIRQRTALYLPAYAFVGSLSWLTLTLSSDALISALFGSEFAETATILNILAAFVAIRLLSLPAVLALTALDRLRAAVTVQVSAAALNICANAILIPQYGALGSAFATLVSEGWLLIAMWWLMPRLWRRALLVRPLVHVVMAGALITFGRGLGNDLVSSVLAVFGFGAVFGSIAYMQVRRASRLLASGAVA